jgi:hypothetical protein
MTEVQALADLLVRYWTIPCVDAENDDSNGKLHVTQDRKMVVAVVMKQSVQSFPPTLSKIVAEYATPTRLYDYVVT